MKSGKKRILRVVFWNNF